MVYSAELDYDYYTLRTVPVVVVSFSLVPSSLFLFTVGGELNLSGFRRFPLDVPVDRSGMSSGKRQNPLRMSLSPTVNENEKEDMPSTESADVIVLSSKTLFADVSNVIMGATSSISENKFTESYYLKKWRCRHNPKILCFSYEKAMQQENMTLMHLREKIEKPVIQELCNRVHHSTYSLENLVESIVSYLEDFYVKGENLEFSPSKDRTVIAKVLAVEKKGGAVFYTIQYDGKEIGRINGSDLKRRYSITEDDIRSIVLLMGSQQPGRPWQIEETYKKEYGIKDKLAPIFCSPTYIKSTNKITTTAKQNVDNGGKDSDSDSDAPLSHFIGQRRSGVALPPSASLKEVDKGKRKQGKKQQKEKLEKEKAQKENRTWGLNKFICSTYSNEGNKSDSSSSIFLTPQKRSEKRFNSAMNKLQHAWRKHDEQGFIAAAAWSAKVLSGVQIDRIPNECHRFAVRKAYIKAKDAEMLKKIRTKEARTEFRKKVHEERHEYQKIMLAKIKAHFNQDAAEEDLLICDEPLPCPGILLVPSEQSALFTECLVLTQFFSSFRKFIEAEHNISAGQLFDAVHDGRIGFVRYTAKLFGSLLKVLVQDPEYGTLTHFNLPLQEFAIEENTVSELCRALLIGNLVSGEEKVRNAEGRSGCSDEGDINGNEEQENCRGSGSTTPCGFNDVSQIDIVISLQEELSSMPELEEVDRSLLSRTQARKRAELERQREIVEKKIAGIKDRVDDLFEKLRFERLAKSDSKRVVPIGEDRHFRRYFWLNGKSADDGIWIQDMGVSAYEKFVRACIRAGKPFELDVNKCNQDCIQIGDQHNENGYHTSIASDSLSEEANTTNDWPDFVPESCTELWRKLPDEKSFENLVNSLCKVGIREGKLKASLLKKKDIILSSMANTNRWQSETPDQLDDVCDDEDISADSITPLQKSIVQLASDLRSSYLTSMGSLDAFEVEMTSCTTLSEIKEKLCELADTITPSAIVRRLDFKVALQTGQHSVMVLDRWKQRLSECHNASGVHLLRSYLDSRIDWRSSVVEKCTRKRFMEGYHENHVDDKRTRAKRAKSNPVATECTELLSRIKSSSRLYRTLQNIPHGRITRRAVSLSINALEDAVTTYSSLRSFAADLNTFLKYARSYFEEHNERKLDEFEAVVLDLKLESLINR
uniref:WAC domain-containing protein n=1 Tax=Angiostrongylus cantonensis TaxID=6313 RepID=A0A0K0DK40_ANGCA